MNHEQLSVSVPTRLEKTAPAPFGDDLMFAMRVGTLRNNPVLKPVNSTEQSGRATLEVALNVNDLEAYLRWQEVRRGRVVDGTGLEGYYADVPEAELEAKILTVGRELLSCLYRDFPYDAVTRRRHLTCLVDYVFDLDAMHYWDSVFGAILGKKRAELHKKPALQQFRKETELLILTLPKPRVLLIQDGQEKSGRVVQTYEVVRKPALSLGHSKESDERIIAEKIGVIGTPIARFLLQQWRG